jgi:ABC-type nitrate/sulfonate/bicarbonate transport system permease component
VKRRVFESLGPALGLALALSLAWELLVRVTHVSDRILPAPTAIAAALVGHWDVLANHTFQTVLEAVIGLAVSVVLGVVTAIILDSSATVRRAVYPLLVTSQTIPIIALAPLLLIWLGFGLLPKVIIVILYCFFPIAIATASGFAGIAREQLDLFRSLRATYWQTLTQLKIPATLPSFFAGLKIAVTYSVIAAIIGEYVGAYQGLGVFIQTSANSHAVPLVFAAIFVTAAVSMLLFALVMLAEHLLIPSRLKK